MESFVFLLELVEMYHVHLMNVHYIKLGVVYRPILLFENPFIKLYIYIYIYIYIYKNKCIRSCLNLNNRAHIGQKEFKNINWLPVKDHFKQIIGSMLFKFCNNTSYPYMNDVFKPVGGPNTNPRGSLLKLNQPFQRTHHGQNNIFYIATIIWNNLLSSLKQQITLTLTSTS